MNNDSPPQGLASAVPSTPKSSRALASEGIAREAVSPKNRALDRVAPQRTIKRLAILVLFLSIVSTPLFAQLSYSQQAKQIGTHLKCVCRGCDMSAGLCAHPGGAFSGPCDTAKSMLKEVDAHLAKGETEQQIIDAFVAQYGTVVYMEPPKKGFGLVAWLMPVFYSIIGLGFVVLVVRKWAIRPPSAAAQSVEAAAANPALDRARAQAARETED
jgi:cytochrome c-type biogenesis protein CcmH/NrfF